ncbi:hypothetical protein OAQ99_06160 [Candidatus Kapabacteria bacterium]|nr:hypothetical protein [Candidatus Kapabacteria bacterium]
MVIKNDKLVNIILIVLFVYVWVINAWVSDDAHITFRSIEQLFAGNGLVFNIGERVQTFTHPLWLLVHLPFRLLTENLYIINVFLSFIFSFATVALILKYCDNSVSRIVIIISLLFSKTFIDYTSSGLENPLSYFLISILFLTQFNKFTVSKKFQIPMISSLLVLCRPDYLILVLPFIIYDLFINKNKLINIIIGLSHLLLWELFSLIYYGSPIPNTMISKFNTGIDRTELISYGLKYFKESFIFDPTIILIFFPILLSLKQNKKLIFKNFVIISILLYLIGVLYAGGGFMSGRFISITVLMSLLLLIDIKLKSKISYLLLGLPIILSIFSFTHTFKFAKHVDNKLGVIHNDISDERLVYFDELGFINKQFNNAKHEWEYFGEKISKGAYGDSLFIYSVMGLLPYNAGVDKHFIDFLGLCDPLLSRFPLSKQYNFRQGHIRRSLPLGYIESILLDSNKIENEKISTFYNDLKYISSSNIFDIERLNKIWKINFHNYDLPKIYQSDEFQEIKYAPYNKVKMKFYLDKISESEKNKDWKTALESAIAMTEHTSIESNIANATKRSLYYLVKLNDQKGFAYLIENMYGKYGITEEFGLDLGRAAKEDGLIDFSINIYAFILQRNPNSKSARFRLNELLEIKN